MDSTISTDTKIDLSLETQMKLLPSIPTDIHKMLERQRDKNEAGAAYMEKALTEALEYSYKEFKMRHRTAAEDTRRIGLMTKYIKLWIDSGFPSSRAIETLRGGLLQMLHGLTIEIDPYGSSWVTEKSGIKHRLSDYQSQII